MERVYDEAIETKIRHEFSGSKDICYLDHAGATLYSDTQIKNICDDLLSNVYGNPHSLHYSSKQSSDLVDQVRRRILKHFNTSLDEYSLIFTSGATAAIKLLLENFDWQADNENESSFDNESKLYNVDPTLPGAYIYTQSNHTSIVGGREIAKFNQIPFFCLGYNETNELLDTIDFSVNTKTPARSNSIFAYPAQCNFSGKKYPLGWIKKVQNGILDSYGLPKNERRHSKWFCLLDAATFCSTNPLDLSRFTPDFVCISFYKIFGYPTGLGALLVRNTSAYTLKKRYFGGGTVEIALPFQNYHRNRRVLHERFEDGTIPFLSIIALDHGLNTLNRLNLKMCLISHHVFELAKYAAKKLKSLTHWNGAPVVELYADTNYDDIREQGGIVLHTANLRKVYVRTGCFCNLGACQKHLHLSDADLKYYYQAGHVCGDSKDLIDGKPTGSIRISFGYMTTQNDVDKLVDMISESFVEVTPQVIPHKKRIYGKEQMQLSRILLYPIKSCRAMEVRSWQLNSKGLVYDREWMIITSGGICLTQKQEPKLCMICPELNLKQQTLTLRFDTDEDTITIPIDNGSLCTSYDLCESKVCNNVIQAVDCGDEVSGWLSYHLNTIGLRLVRQAKEDMRQLKMSRKHTSDEEETSGKLSLANQAQFLLVNNESIRWLQQLIGQDNDIDVVQGPCGRCQMICIDQKTGEKNRKPLVTLSRALSGKLQFGIYLIRVFSEKDEAEITLKVGDSIQVE
ncbi:hypothetical protein RUM43_007150 [Polyplax serrata]|uniref:Molybdenum cofactor sulfurase n=1 Tax=Polyplax serrata TaxID=468196 RepID=A0AAN8S5A5_POLSC